MPWLLSWHTDKAVEDCSIVECVDQAHFGKAVKKEALCEDNGRIGGIARLVQASEGGANRSEQLLFRGGQDELPSACPRAFSGNSKISQFGECRKG